MSIRAQLIDPLAELSRIENGHAEFLRALAEYENGVVLADHGSVAFVKREREEMSIVDIAAARKARGQSEILERGALGQGYEASQ